MQPYPLCSTYRFAMTLVSTLVYSVCVLLLRKRKIMINILDLSFLILTTSVTLTGLLIDRFEKHLPPVILKGFKYGCFAYKGEGASFLQTIEMPKSAYSHFYLFSMVFGTITLVYGNFVYIFGFDVHRYVVNMLYFFLEQDEPSVPAPAALLVLFLLTIQCTRRMYETTCVQVFSKRAQMNLSHYAAGMLHYLGVIIAAVGQAPLFCGPHDRSLVVWKDVRTLILAIPCTVVFLWAWMEQYKSNMILVNLRKDKKGNVFTENYGLPKGRLFDYVCSPHRLTEIIMYITLILLVPTRTFFFIFLWVIANQTITAKQAYLFYKDTFKNFPNDRKILIPHVW